MARADESRRMTPETLGTGVYDPRRFEQFSPEEGTVVPMYRDQDVSVVVWNLAPGQENSLHSHPTSAHVIWILEGEGQSLKGDAAPVPIKAGECVIIPRGVIHGIRNTRHGNLSYLAVTSLGPGGYVRDVAKPTSV